MYRSFAATFEAMEAPFFWRETTLQLPGPWFPREYIIPKEFVAEEDLHQGKKKSADGANKKDDTVRTSNLPPPPVEEDPSDESIRRGSLTFYPNPPEAKKEDSPLSAADDQAELMRWQFRSPHLRKAEAACPQWQNSQEIGPAQSPQVRRMSLWRDDQDSLARQRA